MKKVIVGLTSILFLVIALLLLVGFYPYTYEFPSYPKITHTASGIHGDPVNVILIGGNEEITQSFQTAGWLIPDPITLQTSAKIAADSLLHKSYPTAPVSNLYLYGRVQDMAFEKPTSDVQKRNHIRLWNTGDTMNGQSVWIAEVSYDNGIELSRTNHLPTHHISPTVDTARAMVGADLNKSGLVKQESNREFTQPIFYARNGGGDFYESDGDILVINYSLSKLPLPKGEYSIYELKESTFDLYTKILNAFISI